LLGYRYASGLGGWPLPTMADGDALHITRTKVLSVVEIQKVLKRGLFYQLFSTLYIHKLIRLDKH
jgi:hypothetical protein